jgi:geranylgeranyl diphosphate synthase type II
MKFLKEHTLYIESELERFQLPLNPSNLYHPLRYFLNIGGKRIRPVLTLMAAELFGTNADKVKDAAIAIELFHNFTLLHDDIMDQAPLRRGEVTVHEKYNTNIAILAGDVLFVKAVQALAQQDTQHLPQLLQLFNQTAIEVCEGQQYDMDFESKENVGTEEYLEMIRLKTSVLLGCALQFGGICSGTDEKNQKLLYDFGINLGMAFQIQDDILDLFGDPELVGKQVGGDILAHKKTILSILAQERGIKDNSDAFDKIKLIQDPTEKIKEAQKLFTSWEILKQCSALQEDYLQKAVENLDSIETSGNKGNFIELSNYLFHRSH